MIILAQGTPSSTSVWAAAAGALVLIIGAIGTQVINWMRFKREVEDRKADAALNVEIRDCLRGIEIANTEHHGQVLVALATTTCKAECRNFQSVKPNKEKENNDSTNNKWI